MRYVAVSAINATDNPGPGVPIARSLVESHQDICVHGLSYDLHDPGHYLTEFIKRSFMMPFPSQGWQAVSKKLLDIKGTHGLDYVIPCLDAELPLFVKYQHELMEFGIKSFLPAQSQFDLRSKDKLAVLCDELDCHYPETKILTSIDYKSINESIKNLAFPLLVKGKYYEAFFAYTIEDIIRYGSEISATWGLPVLLQKPVYGEEINLIGVGDGKGNTLGMVAIKKLKTTKLGKIWSGITIENRKLMQLAQHFVKKTHWRGPFELEIIERSKESKTSLKELSLIEINPRFPAWVYFATGAGMNLPKRLLDFMDGKDVPVDNHYEIGKYFIRYTSEIVTSLETLQSLSNL